MSFFFGDSPGPVIIQGLGGPQGPPGPQGSQGIPGTAGSSQLLASVSAVAVTNVASLTGLAQTIDGVAINTVNMRVLLIGQTDSRQNGIYLAQSASWTRSGDFNTGSALQGVAVAVLPGGTWFGGTLWEMSSAATVTVDTDGHLWNLCSYPMLQGTHANRPPAATWNRWLRYAETDTLFIYQSDGTAWNETGALSLRKYGCGVHYSGANSLGLRTDALVPHNTKDYDPNNNFNTSTHLYTCPVTGYYLVNVGLRLTAGPNPNTLFVGAGIYKNATSGTPQFIPHFQAGDWQDSIGGGSDSRVIHCNAGDTIGASSWADEDHSNAIFYDNTFGGGNGNHMEIQLIALG